jgi:drug/metabolite transporter (DMT)-like permease
VSAQQGHAPALDSRTFHRSGGIRFVVLALLCFGALDTTTKFASATAPLVMALWVRYGVQAVATTAVLWPSRGPSLFVTKRPLMQFVRGLLLVVCSGIAFLSLRVMPVGEFTAIVMLTPLLLTVVAAVMLGERVSWLRWLCVVAGFAGAMVVIRPGKDLFDWAMVLPLVLVAANTGFQALTSRMARTEDPGTMHVYTGLVGLVVTSAALPFAWQALPWPIWAAIGLMGVFSTLGHFLLIVAFRRTPVAVLTPYLYLQIAFASLGGWLVFSHVPDAWSLAGITLIAIGGVFGTWLTGREALARKRLTSPESTSAAIAGADAN